MQFSFHDKRLAALEHELRAGAGPCPLVCLDPAAGGVRLTHFSGGSGATYIAVQALRPAAINIGYAPFVEGTALIYDLSDETLQGKARPFVCDLRDRHHRVYAVLPAQIESIRIGQRGGEFTVEFLDACGERTQAALPFYLAVADNRGTRVEAFATTNSDGRYASIVPPELDVAACQIAVRSLLTGRTQRLALHAS